MPKYRKFNEGGSSGLEDFEDKAMPKRYSALEELASGQEKGSFDEDTYARARRFLERGEQPAAAAKPAARRTVPPAGTPGGAYRGQRSDMVSAPAGEIPKASAVSSPASTGEDTSGPSNLDRILMGVGAGAGVAGAAKLAQMRRAKQAAETAKAAASKFAQPQARQATSETGRRFGPKAEMEAAESTMRGAVGRKDIQAKRAAAAKGRAETMEANKPVMQATPKKASPRARTRDEDTDYELRAKGGRIGYALGGKVRGGGCEMRGKTRGVMR